MLTMHGPESHIPLWPCLLGFCKRGTRGRALAVPALAVMVALGSSACAWADESAQPPQANPLSSPLSSPFFHWPFEVIDQPAGLQQAEAGGASGTFPPPVQAPSASGSAAPTIPPLWDFTLGSTFKSSDLAQFTRTASLEPIVGLRYDRWKLGIGDGTEWLRFNSFRKDSSLDYRWLDTHRYSLSLSMQLHTLTAGEGSDAPESGPRTVRGRAIGSMAITRRWQAGMSFTQDLLGKGDGSTLGLGLAYVWPMDVQSEMVLNAGLTWGTAGHWRNAYGPMRLGANTLHDGVDSWGLGLSYKHRLAKHWAWFGSLSFSGDMGPLAQLLGTHAGRSGQIGLLYFHR